MKLATLKNASRDGQLVVVSRDMSRAIDARSVAPTLQQAIENWAEAEPRLQALARELENHDCREAFAFDPAQAMAPLPRAYQWCDGSAFLSHGALMQKAFNLDPIEGADRTPLMYQGAGDDFIGAHDDIQLPSESQGIDFEGEFVVLVDDVPMGCSAESALQHIKLILQINDVSLRALAPREMRTGFGFLQAKPSSSFAPLAITPDELGEAWRDGRVNLPLQVQWNDEWFGQPHGAQMNFHFGELIAHAALTRRLRAGTLIGSGTVSNVERNVGSACIAERRAIEMIEHGAPVTGFMRFGDRVRMDVTGSDGQSLFGAIDQRVVKAHG
ncbi:FAA hydrolase family protein [Pseudomonas sp. MYb2]|uniref:fumarylacetoacetate hydrolase family protein n=1 Tax=unclassified Pseudomonas TaxID=196821 RepID=UPI0006D6F92B|nr:MULTISPECIES: fumarylacetoacetate hydrolase family protein [unclassified Pseudomonas]KPG96335.1 fumarylacetoacetate hydrolase [Pseudomonas sp. RIT-PI-r]PRB51041.1 FAA hydrolase family protein [Pseudomonas sp. MYb3]PRC34420.1 FAA hydrolase family protein [Pseudomonas sp. MYb2]